MNVIQKLKIISMVSLLCFTLPLNAVYAEGGEDLGRDTETGTTETNTGSTESGTMETLNKIEAQVHDTRKEAQKAATEAQNTAEAVEVQTNEIKALTATNEALNATLNAYYNATPADNPATPLLWRGLDLDKTIYIYSIDIGGTKYYTASNTAALRVYKNSDDSSDYMRIDNAYIKDNKQQVTIWYDDINKAKSPLWGYSTVSYVTKNAPAWGGLGGWGTYSFYTIQYPETPTQTEVQGTLVGTLTRYYINDNGDPRQGSAANWSNFTLEQTIRPGTAATLNGIYTEAAIIMGLLIFWIFKRGR